MLYFLYYTLLSLAFPVVSLMYSSHVKYYNLLFLLDKDGASIAENTTHNSRFCGEGRFIASHDSIYGSFVFTMSEQFMLISAHFIIQYIVYLVEMTVRLLAVGPIEYFRKWWNRFDVMI